MHYSPFQLLSPQAQTVIVVSSFLKATWHLTGAMVCDAIQEFFDTGEMQKFMSATKLVILPKIAHPQAGTDFRPISCCNILYKCITKMLCSKIKAILPSLINQSQAAFVQNRELLCNVLICQDIVRGYKRKHVPRPPDAC